MIAFFDNLRKLTEICVNTQRVVQTNHFHCEMAQLHCLSCVLLDFLFFRNVCTAVHFP